MDRNQSIWIKDPLAILAEGAERGVVVQDGRIIELGTHAQLVARGGRYASMYATWISQAEAQAA